MSDSEKTLSTYQKGLLDDWLDERWTGHSDCPICEKNAWTTSKYIVSPPIFMGKTFEFGGPQYPQIMVICTYCGHTLYFNAMIIGLLASDEESGENEGSDGD